MYHAEVRLSDVGWQPNENASYRIFDHANDIAYLLACHGHYDTRVVRGNEVIAEYPINYNGRKHNEPITKWVIVEVDSGNHYCVPRTIAQANQWRIVEDVQGDH